MGISLIKRIGFDGTSLEKSLVFSKGRGIIIFIFLTALGAYLYIPLPFTPVPITLQTFFVILSGAILGPWRGFLSQLGYLSFGAMGLPIFFGGRGGMFHLLGPTGGYLWGFLLSSWLAGKLIYGKKTNSLILFIYFTLSILIIYLFGIIQLNFFVKKNLFLLFQLGVLPFLLPDFLKISLAILGYRWFKKGK